MLVNVEHFPTPNSRVVPFNNHTRCRMRYTKSVEATPSPSSRSSYVRRTNVTVVQNSASDLHFHIFTTWATDRETDSRCECPAFRARGRLKIKKSHGRSLEIEKQWTSKKIDKERVKLRKSHRAERRFYD